MSKLGGQAGDADIVLGLLTSVEGDSRIAQRKLVRARIKVNQVPLRRYSCYLRPQDFAEKSRLAAAHLSNSFDLFRQARGDRVMLFRQYAEVALDAPTEIRA